MEWIITRLSEPSTWRGLFAMLTAGGISLAPDYENAIIAIGLSIIGLINVIKKEKLDGTPKNK
ncbi:MAG: hypothetical protein BGO49_24370 [Planctomycetales bacterium 71-10]|nr:MAG: hypothetical protein BGO49_24370 [Planctomycetales bacterium 71-10]